MSGVTGAPAKLRERRDELTPMLTQYVELCEVYDEAVVLFRVGDFYKAFCETAEAVARTCELTLIEREDSTGTYAACGIPVDNAARYLDRLLDEGHRLAIADQVEDPDETTGLVDRAVTRIITPGTVVSEELLPTGANTYVACLVRVTTGQESTPDSQASYGLAYVDVSTGECAVTAVDDRAKARAELARIDPAELLVGPDVDIDPPEGITTTEHDTDAFDPENARECVRSYVSPDVFAGSDRTGSGSTEYGWHPEAALIATGALLAYAEWTQGDDGPLEYVTRVRRYDSNQALRLDSTALRGLELFENDTGSRTLFDTLDETVSALGRRRLRAWLRRPLIEADAIRSRHEAVGTLVSSPLVRRAVRDRLEAVYDLERLVSRTARERADARDLRALHATLESIPKLRSDIAEIDALADVREILDPLAETRDLIDRAICEDPSTEITEGGVIRDGYDATLDDLRETAREGRAWVADLEADERERTGIENLEVGYNEVHGYYIEVTNGQLDKVPDDYTRRQTLKNSERFYTPELKRREDEILGASERANAREHELFREVRARIAEEADRLQALADGLARLDALTALGTVAVDRDYARPEMAAGSIDIEAGRHPVVEHETEFVPNDAHLPEGTVALVTGPNMSGKSTYMRQIALICILAQAGSFVPARSARLPILDRVFTRVGASDDIAGGESTFMREMAELTDVLHDATSDSLVLLDEVGRGTSTADGRAIARAAAEFIHDEVGATTLFATHYHALTDLAAELTRVRNLHFAASKTNGDITFLHRVREGAASSSYGIDVADMAGVPSPVVERARTLIESEPTHDAEEHRGADPPAGSDHARNGHASAESVASKNGEPVWGAHDDPDVSSPGDEVFDVLRAVEVAETTPLEALQILNDLQRQLEGDTPGGGGRNE